MAHDSNPNHSATKVTALVGLGADRGSEKPNAGDIKIASFDEAPVRGRFYKREWWLSIIDVIEALAITTQPARYWNELKAQLSETEGFSELFGQIEKLKMPSADGKLRGTEAVTVKTLLRVLQSVPSPKLEPLKQWLAQVGFERVQEATDPSKALERLINLYLTKGRTAQWIRERIDGIITRRDLTDEWRDRGITSEYAKLTRMLQLRSIGLGPKEHRELKGLEDHHSLRDHSTEMEIILTRLGERSTIEIARARDAQGYEQNRDAVKAGGDIAKTARKRIEKLTGKPVASKANFLPKPEQISPPSASGPSSSC